MDRLLQLEVFSKTAELGSLSKAADTLRMSNAAASRHLSALEERLAVRLIERNTRRQWLTEAGQELLAALQHAAERTCGSRGRRQRPRAVAQGHAARHELAVVCDDLHRADAAGLPQALSEAQRPDHRRQPLSRFHRGRHRRRDPHARAGAGFQHHHPPHRPDAPRAGGRTVLSRERTGDPSSPPISRVTTCWSTISPTILIRCG